MGMVAKGLGLTALVVALASVSGSATAEEDAQNTAEVVFDTAINVAVTMGKAAAHSVGAWNDAGPGPVGAVESGTRPPD